MPAETTVQPRDVHRHQFENGLVLLCEESREVESAAFTLLVPCGYSVDPPERLGLANLLCDMALRGAGQRDSRALVNDLEILGLDGHESVGAAHTSFGGATLAENLYNALAIYADIVQRPWLPDEQLDAGRQVCMQEIRGVEDEPASKLIEELRRCTYPDPWGRPNHGNEAGVMSATISDVRNLARAAYRPNGAILGVAGNVDWPRLLETVSAHFGDWPDGQPPTIVEKEPVDKAPHVPFDSNQCHIGIAFPTAPYRDPHYLRAWAAIGILSDGMSSRLFTEVREKRGLCYSVHASLQTLLTQARVLCYAGTTAERAQETLDVTHAELIRLGQGVEQSELDRLKARIKSGLIMQQESTSARSGALARDWYHLQRIRTLDELSSEIDQLTARTINEYLGNNPPRDFTYVTLGPQPLKLPA